MLYRSRNTEPEPPGKGTVARQKLSFNRKKHMSLGVMLKNIPSLEPFIIIYRCMLGAFVYGHKSVLLVEEDKKICSGDFVNNQ